MITRLDPPSSNCTVPLRVTQASLDPSCAFLGIRFDPVEARKIWLWRKDAGKPEKVVEANRFQMIPWSPSFDPCIAVFSATEQWSLTYNLDLGWVWLYVGKDGLRDCSKDLVSPETSFSLGEPNPLNFWKPKHPAPDPSGWTIYTEFDNIRPNPGEELREKPDLGAPSLGPLNGKVLKMIEFRGNWVLVQESIESAEVEQSKDREEVPLVKVRWNPRREGWIRWRVPGPVPGSWSVRLQGHSHFGEID